MRLVRGPGAAAVFIAVVGLAVRASYLNLHGRPHEPTSVALGLAVLLLHMMVAWPALRPPRPPKVTVTAPDAEPGWRYGHDDAGNVYTRDGAGNLYRMTEMGTIPMPLPPSPPRWWNWPARVVLVPTWLVRGGLLGYGAYFVAQELDRGFNLTLFELALTGQVLVQLRLFATALSGFRVDWSGYRGWGAVRTVANIAVTALLAGYVFVVADLMSTFLLAIPLGIYRTLDGWWHLPWLNIPIVVVGCVIAFVILAVIVSWVQGLVARALGPDSKLGEKLDELRLIKWEGESPRELFRDW